MESEEKLSKNLEFPVQKDTISVPQGGYTLLRFLADNPGFWIFESQMLFESHLGMKLKEFLYNLLLKVQNLRWRQTLMWLL
ncbi:Laccase-14 [Armadillidium vulgare]|nr:Laccase-14 [Armadillidium vulgare]